MIHSCTFEENKVADYGGAVFATENSKVSIAVSHFEANDANGSGAVALASLPHPQSESSILSSSRTGQGMVVGCT